MDTKSKTHEANPQKGFVVQINASENFGLAGLAASTYGYSAPKAPEPWVPVAAENGSHPCLIDYDTLCSVLR